MIDTYRGYRLVTNVKMGHTAIWHGQEWLDETDGPDSLAQAQRRVDEWVEAR